MKNSITLLTFLFASSVAFADTYNSSTNINRNDLANNRGMAQGQIQGQGQSQTSTGGSSTVSVNAGGSTYNDRFPAAGAYASSIAPTAPCMGSSSGGVQGMSFGVSVGGAWTDTNCMTLEQVRVTSTVLNDPELAAEIMCGLDAYREARIRVGRPCKGAPTTTTVNAEKPQYTDPIVRKRLGLPPL